MYDERSTEITRIIFLLDILCTLTTFLFSYWARGFFLPGTSADLYAHLALVPLIIALLITFLSYFGAYTETGRCKNLRCCWSVFKAMSITVGILLSLLFFFKVEYVSRLVVFVFAAADFVVLCAIRIIAILYYRQTIKDEEKSLLILVIGTGDRARELVSNLQAQFEWGVKIVGYLDPDPKRVGGTVDGVSIIGTVDNIGECLKQHVIDEVIIAIPRSLLEDAEPIVQACEQEGIKLRFMADIFNLHVARISLSKIGNVPLLTLEPVAMDEEKLLVKRIIDLTLTTLSMPVVLPLMAIISLAIKANSPGPVFFVQQRVGLRKHIFPMFKFRSMYIDAEERFKEVEHLNEAEGPIFKMTNDPRVTPVGRFLRKTSLDELPQLFNVLRGEMSLVGPRPMSIRDVDLFDKGIQRKRFSVKPGLTCIWQVSGRSNLTFEQWLDMDLEYIENWSLWLDLKILLQTVPAVLLSRGAM